MNIKRFIKLLALLVIPTFLTGCFNYYDINKLTFATSVIFDEDENENVVVYVDCIKPYRSTGEGEDKARRIMYKSEGKTAVEALKNINLTASNIVNYSQSRAYIFTENAAKKGIEKYLGLINNNQQFQVKPDMFIYSGDIEELLKASSKDEEYLGQYLEELINRNKTNPKAISANVNDYLSNVTDENDAFIVGSLKLKEDAFGPKIELSGGAVLKNNKLVAAMNTSEVIRYNVLMNKINDGILEIKNPQTKEGLITLQVLGTSVESDIKVEDGNINLIKDIEIILTIAESQDKLIVDDELIDYVKKEMDSIIREYLVGVFNKFKEKDLDIFEVERLLDVNYSRINIDNPISKTNIDVNVNIIMDGTSLIKDTL